MRRGLLSSRRWLSSSSASRALLQVCHQRLAIGGPRRGAADAVQFQAHRVGNAELAPQARQERDQLRIRVRRRMTEQLRTNLVELSLAPLLRALVPETSHRRTRVGTASRPGCAGSPRARTPPCLPAAG
jgi:hypothetical protein